MKTTCFLVVLLLGFPALAQEAGRLDDLKASYFNDDPAEVFDELKAGVEALEPADREALLKRWVIGAVESNNDAIGASELDLCSRLGANMDMRYEGDVLSREEGDWLLHAVIRSQVYLGALASDAETILALVRYSNVCRRNRNGEKPSDVFALEMQSAGSWVGTERYDEIVAAFKLREKELGCPNL